MYSMWRNVMRKKQQKNTFSVAQTSGTHIWVCVAIMLFTTKCHSMMLPATHLSISYLKCPGSRGKTITISTSVYDCGEIYHIYIKRKKTKKKLYAWQSIICSSPVFRVCCFYFYIYIWKWKQSSRIAAVVILLN